MYMGFVAPQDGADLGDYDGDYQDEADAPTGEWEDDGGWGEEEEVYEEEAPVVEEKKSDKKEKPKPVRRVFLLCHRDFVIENTL